MKKTNIIIFIATCILFAILTFIFNWSWFYYFVSMLGIVQVMSLADRTYLSIIISIFANLTYVIVAYEIRYYGDAIFYLFVSTPLLIASMFTWKKHLTKDNLVSPKTMSKELKVFFLIIGFVFTNLYAYFLQKIGGVFSLLDALSTITSVFGYILLMLRFKEQWVVWLMQYCVTILMYIAVKDVLMLTMSLYNFTYSAIGYFQWKNGARVIEN